jgi:hypothetical protein
VNGGLRYTLFQQVGPFDRYIKDPETGVNIDTIFYEKGENIKTYSNIEPRLSLRYITGANSSLKASFTQNYQYIHMVSTSSLSLPTDVWVPSSSMVKPQFGTQYAIGYFQNLKNNIYEASVEVYYKDLRNQIEYKEDALPENTLNDNVDNNFTFGNGWSYGAEFFIKKTFGKFNGWIGYTWAKTERKFNDLNNGDIFYAKYDRRHDLTTVMVYDLSKKWTFGATWVYATGNTMTLPVSRYFINGRFVSEYSTRNGYRMDPYHRLDISATLHNKKKKKFESSWVFSIYNVYSRKNTFFIYFDDVSDYENNIFSIQAKQVSLFPILPSVTFNFKF